MHGGVGIRLRSIQLILSVVSGSPWFARFGVVNGSNAPARSSSQSCRRLPRVISLWGRSAGASKRHHVRGTWVRRGQRGDTRRAHERTGAWMIVHHDARRTGRSGAHVPTRDHVDRRTHPGVSRIQRRGLKRTTTSCVDELPVLLGHHQGPFPTTTMRASGSYWSVSSGPREMNISRMTTALTRTISCRMTFSNMCPKMS